MTQQAVDWDVSAITPEELRQMRWQTRRDKYRAILVQIFAKSPIGGRRCHYPLCIIPRCFCTLYRTIPRPRNQTLYRLCQCQPTTKCRTLVRYG